MRTYPFIKAFCHKQPVGAESYARRLKALCQALDRADHVVVGAGAGLSAAAGLEYDGKRFAENFGDFFIRYHITDMYSAMFYPFDTEEERWAYLARHIRLNRYDNNRQTELYRRLYDIVSRKDYFVITTNVDGLFEKAGFAPERIFAVQGDYAYMQCAKGCHDGFYYNEALVREMDDRTKDCHVPSSLVPYCPVCGGRMEVHVRKDEYFVQDSRWHEKFSRYQSFMQKTYNRRTLLLELGVGYNTPTIIRFPFERMAAQKKNITLVRINRDYAEKQADVHAFLPFRESINKVISDVSSFTKFPN